METGKEHSTDALISVIVPVYNVQEYLAECVDSIRNQSYRNLEIILVDDGSTDQSGAMCDAFAAIDPRVVVLHKKNGGLADARNAGLGIAGGEYIGYVDSDDYIEPDMYGTLLRACIRHKAKLSCIRYDQVGGEDGQLPSADGREKVLSAGRYLADILTLNKREFANFSACVRLYHKSIVSGLYFTAGKCYEDVLYSTKAIHRAGRCVYVNKVKYHYRIRKGSITHAEYGGSFDRKIITDLLGEEKAAVRYLVSVGDVRAANLAKAMYYQQMMGYFAVNTYHEYDGILKDALKEWRLDRRQIARLPLRIHRKIILWAKMAMPQASCVIYRIKNRH